MAVPLNKDFREKLAVLIRKFCEDNKIKYDSTTKAWIEPPYVFKTDGTQCTHEEVEEIKRVGIDRFYSDKALCRNLVMGS